MEDRLNELPKGWIWTTIQDAVSSVSLTGKKLKQSLYQVNGKYPVIDQGQTFIGGYTDKEEFKISSDTPLIIFGDHTKVFKYIDFQFVAGADGVKVIKPEEIFYPKLFYYFAQVISLPEKGYARHFQWLEKSAIPLPPLPEQHRIVTKIEELFTKLDAGVEALKKIKAQLKRYRQAVLKYAFEGKLTQGWREAHKGELEPASVLLERIKDQRLKEAKGKFKDLPPIDTSELTELPEGWTWTRVGVIGTVTGGKRLPKGHIYSETSTDYPYIRVIDFENMTVNTDNLVFLKPETQRIIQRYTISKEDIYISIAGSIGKVGLIPNELDGANLTENAAKITVMNNIDKKFLSYSLNSAFSQGQISRLTISSNQPKLALFRIEQITIPLTSVEEQQKIVEEIETRFSIADNMEKVAEQSLKQSDRLRQSILKRAFEGKLVPQDPTDEPADKLLERIKEEKVKREAENKKEKKHRGKTQNRPGSRSLGIGRRS